MNVSILGCGVYGLALANSFLAKKKSKVSMWSKFEKEINVLNEKYLSVSFSTDLEEATKEADLLVIAIPVAFLEETMISLRDVYKGQDILIASKGIDGKGLRFAHEIVSSYLANAPIGVISGGTFAQDMQDKKVMGLTLATTVDSIREKVELGLEQSFLKVQYTDDVIGTSVCGAIKNVMAIGFGILDGANFPPSSRFLFLTEAIYEIQYFIELLGGNKDTIMSYAGIDDIMMTCTSSQSRNYTMGSMLGSEKSVAEIEEYKNNTTIEGLGTSHAIYHLAKVKKIDLPICTVIYQILYENHDYSELVKLLEKRGLRSRMDLN